MHHVALSERLFAKKIVFYTFDFSEIPHSWLMLLNVASSADGRKIKMVLSCGVAIIVQNEIHVSVTSNKKGTHFPMLDNTLINVIPFSALILN